jgi:hypothetical protein
MWLHAYENEMARCPYPHCNRAWLKVAPGRVVSTRTPVGGYAPAGIGTVTCRECRRNFEAAVNLPGAAPEGRANAPRIG